MRAIDADAFKDYIREACEDLAPLFNDNGKVARLVTENFCKDIDEQPTIQPEIVRCKDCKHWIPYDWMFSEVWRSKNMADYPEDEIGCNCSDMAMKANDFCSRGEKREVNHESN